LPKTPPEGRVARTARSAASFTPRRLRTQLAELLPQFPDVALCVAFSGGLDSTALLAALRQLRDAPLRLRALHIDHGLQSKSRAWSAHCARVARALGVPFELRRARIVRARGESPEAAARAARYRLLGASLAPGEVLLTAHHADDQLETVLLQLLRGAGVAGIAAMPERAPFAQGTLLRPLLRWTRAELAQWLTAQGLAWVEDDSNALPHADRNYLRLQVLPLIRARWPGAAGSAARVARHAAEAHELLLLLGARDAARAACGAQLSAAVLRALPVARRRNALRCWIAAHGYRAPPASRLTQIAGPLLAARADAHPAVAWEGARVQRQGERLWLLGPASDASRPPALEWPWRRQRVCVLPGGGTLELRRDPHGPIDLAALPPRVRLAARRGGERLRPRRGGPRRALKSLLQEARVPPVERPHLPLVLDGERLLAVADLWIDAAVQAQPGTRQRGRLLYRAPHSGGAV
jgi:tRNA(Ile)-lysidine synthase